MMMIGATFLLPAVLSLLGRKAFAMQDALGPQAQAAQPGRRRVRPLRPVAGAPLPLGRRARAGRPDRHRAARGVAAPRLHRRQRQGAEAARRGSPTTCSARASARASTARSSWPSQTASAGRRRRRRSSWPAPISSRPGRRRRGPLPDGAGLDRSPRCRSCPTTGPQDEATDGAAGPAARRRDPAGDAADRRDRPTSAAPRRSRRTSPRCSPTRCRCSCWWSIGLGLPGPGRCCSARSWCR